MSTTDQSIAASSIPSLVHDGVSVITTEQLAMAFETDANTLRQNLKRNANRFEEGKHCFKLRGESLREFRLRVTNSHSQISSKARSIILYTKRGSFRHAKILGTDRAWDVQDALEEHYFDHPRPHLAEHRPSIERQEARTKGKEARKILTDAIKRFVEYAMQQGSKNAKRYYKNITDMMYKVLFLLDAATIKEGNIRDRLDLEQLSLLDVADRQVARVLDKCMEAGMPYKDAYKATEECVQALAAVVGRRKQ